ncbi:response regulator transcription factor [Streptomyces sp. NPDC000987]|uniref:helix-turn-helix transcriptional regulator n=1 Tax=Streptomyces sp. NPDC000987 TaxID=3154374 RepID=UPI00332D6722
MTATLAPAALLESRTPVPPAGHVRPTAPVTPAAHIRPTAPAGPAVPPASAALCVLPARGADRVRALARRAGLSCVDGHPEAGTVTVVVAQDAEEALRGPWNGGPLLLVCDTVSRTGLLRALRAGAVVLRSEDLTPETLTAAVRRAGHPHPSIPYPELSHLLNGGPAPRRPDRSGNRPPSLTARQTSVLRLMAEGHANADIARLLDCSEHTVKNVIYEIMARLQARNRAHAVAHAVRHGLV